MTDRLTADTINSDALDALYDHLDRARDAAALHRRGLITAAALYAVIEAAPEPGPAAPQATEPCTGRVCAGAGCSHERAATALIAHDQAAGHYPTEPHTGLVVQPYTENGQQKWVFRCWGTDDGCDGWLSLDHYSEQSAIRACDRHVTEEHADQPEEQR